MQDTADSPQTTPPHFSVSRLTTRLNSQHAPKGEIQSVIQEKVCYTTKELFQFYNLCRHKSGEQVWEWILRIWDNGGRNMIRHLVTVKSREEIYE